MKNQNKIIIVVIAIILLLGVTTLILYSTGVLQSALYRTQDSVNANNLGNGVWALSGASYNSNVVGGVRPDAEGKFNFQIDSWGGSTRGDAGRAMRLQTAIDSNPSFASFTSSHNMVDPYQTACKQGTWQPFDTENNWEERIGVTEYNLGYGNMAWCLSTTNVQNILDNSFMVFKGYYTDNACNRQEVETYGMCNGGGTCWLVDPIPDVGDSYDKWCGSNLIGTNNLIPNSWNLYFKEGGYTEEDSCLEFNLGCPEVTIYRLEENQCNEYTILDKDRLISDFLTLAQCQLNIENEINVYRLEDNLCTQQTILESERTQNDFDTLLECEEGIVKDPTSITVYSLKDNQCTQQIILDSEKTDLDFDTKEDCELNIIPSTCSEGQTNEFTCSDGEEVTWCICQGGEWDCRDNPEEQCKHKINYILYGALGVLGIFIILIIVLIMTKKKR